MKKSLLLKLLMLILAVCSVLCITTGCHTHVFDQKIANETYFVSSASCSAKASYYYSCACGEKGTTTFEYGEVLGHSFTE